MAYKSIPTEQAYRIAMLAERSAKLRAQSDRILDQARQIMRELGLNPDVDQAIVDDATFNGRPLPIGTVLRQGRPVEEPEALQETPVPEVAIGPS
jgi:transcriptional regulator of met regulon